MKRLNGTKSEIRKPAMKLEVTAATGKAIPMTVEIALERTKVPPV